MKKGAENRERGCMQAGFLRNQQKEINRILYFSKNHDSSKNHESKNAGFCCFCKNFTVNAHGTGT